MIGDPTLDAVTAGALGLFAVVLVFEIVVRWAVGSILGRDGGGWDGPE
jgi:hypothetical protein